EFIILAACLPFGLLVCMTGAAADQCVVGRQRALLVLPLLLAGADAPLLCGQRLARLLDGGIQRLDKTPVVVQRQCVGATVQRVLQACGVFGAVLQQHIELAGGLCCAAAVAGQCLAGVVAGLAGLVEQVLQWRKRCHDGAPWPSSDCIAACAPAMSACSWMDCCRNASTFGYSITAWSSCGSWPGV